jgi:hypothetical protein
MLADHVLKKLLEAELESAADPQQDGSHHGQLQLHSRHGQQIIDGRPCYELQVEPKDELSPPLSRHHLGRRR